MTIAEARRELPDVQVMMPDGNMHVGRVVGRQNQFPTVGVKDYPTMGEWFDFESSWAQIARIATNKTPIVYC